VRDGATDALRVLDDRYELVARIGSGGMGSVFRAHDRRLDRTVAVKLLRSSGDEVHRARLQAEARFAGGLQHPGIVRVYDYGEERSGHPDDPAAVTPYVVMQLVDGEPLSQRLRRTGPLPAAEVAAVVAGVADALAEAHARGVVHRDLKPSNIVLTPTGEPVLVDFGVARSDSADPLTETGSIIGTVDYLSPEQVEGHRATGASDVYALGVVAHQCLTGTSPFHRESQVATALAHLRDEVGELPSGLPSGLRSLVRDMLRRDPEARPSAAEVAARAVPAASTRAIVLPPPPADPVGSALAGVVPVPPALTRLPHPTTRGLHGRAVLVVAVALAIVVVGIGMAVAGRHPTAPSAAADSSSSTRSAAGHRPVKRSARLAPSSATRTPTAGRTAAPTAAPAVTPVAATTHAPPRRRHPAPRHRHAPRHHHRPGHHHGPPPGHGHGHGHGPGPGHGHGHGHGRH
jgi:serine/threonine-protein kinase